MVKAKLKFTIRIDKWLWFARFFKTRSRATKICENYRVRIDKRVINHAHALIQVGNVLTFPQDRRIRVVRVLDIGKRRGPASEAALLYEDLSPPEPQTNYFSATVVQTQAHAIQPRGLGRPTKAHRRAIERLRDTDI